MRLARRMIITVVVVAAEREGSERKSSVSTKRRFRVILAASAKDQLNAGRGRDLESKASRRPGRGGWGAQSGQIR